MARGFDSKFVEAQQEEAARRVPAGPARTPEQRAREAHRQSLTLSRTRAGADLLAARNPAHRRMLEQAIAALDAELDKLG